jgi:Gpi18-like mannosyltransferase
VKLSALNQKIPKSLKIALLIVILAKILVFAIGYAFTATNEPIINGQPAAPLTIIMQEFNRWDAPHYVDLAKNWYNTNPSADAYNFIVFFPLYPILIRANTFNFDYANLSALIVSNVCSIVAFLYLYKLTKLEFSDSVAQKTVIFLSIFPTAYFLTAPYTEGLFFATVIASFYYARLGKWFFAGVLSMLAALSRLGGLFMVPVLLLEYLHQKGWKLRQVDARIFWASIGIAGFLIYLGINYQVTGNAFMFMEIEKTHWYNTLNPVEGLNQAIYWIFNRSFPESFTIGLSPIIFAVFGLLATVGAAVAAVGKTRFRPSYVLYMLLTWMLAVSTSWWVSVPRYVMAMFPMFILFGVVSKRKIVTLTIASVFLAGLCFYTALFALHWWAF